MKRLVTLFVGALLFVSSLHAADDPLSRDAVSAALEEFRPEAIGETEKEIADTLAELKKAPKGATAAQYRKDLSNTLAGLKKKLAGLKSGDVRPMPKFDFYKAKVGYFGRCSMQERGNEWLRVIEVRGKKDVVVVTGRTGVTLKRSGAIRPKDSEGTKEFIIRGVDAAKLTDDEMLYLNGVYRVTGTTKIDSGTVFVIERFDIDEFLKVDPAP